MFESNPHEQRSLIPVDVLVDDLAIVEHHHDVNGQLNVQACRRHVRKHDRKAHVMSEARGAAHHGCVHIVANKFVLTWASDNDPRSVGGLRE
jgi:hypothetical protein